MRKKVIVWLTFIGGLFFFCEYFLPEESGLSEYVPDVGKIEQVVAGFAVALGMINLLKAHVARIARMRPGWHNSAALATGLFVMLFTQIWLFHYDASKGGAPGTVHTVIFEVQRLLFKAVNQGCSATIFSLLAFYMASAAYRAFRVKSMEAGIMMVVAVIVMLGQIPLGTQVVTGRIGPDSPLSFLRLENAKNWIMDVLNTGAQRGVAFGVYIGSLAMTLRIWLSLEAGAFFEDK